MHIMRRPDNPGRKIGDREKLISLTYWEIAKWSGLSLNTVRQYASLKHFDKRDIYSTLGWINARRAAKGLIAIGHPDHDPVEEGLIDVETISPPTPNPPSTKPDDPQNTPNQDTTTTTTPLDAVLPSHSSSCRCSSCYLATKTKKT